MQTSNNGNFCIKFYAKAFLENVDKKLRKYFRTFYVNISANVFCQKVSIKLHTFFHIFGGNCQHFHSVMSNGNIYGRMNVNISRFTSSFMFSIESVLLVDLYTNIGT